MQHLHVFTELAVSSERVICVFRRIHWRARRIHASTNMVKSKGKVGSAWKLKFSSSIIPLNTDYHKESDSDERVGRSFFATHTWHSVHESINSVNCRVTQLRRCIVLMTQWHVRHINTRNSWISESERERETGKRHRAFTMNTERVQWINIITSLSLTLSVNKRWIDGRRINYFSSNENISNHSARLCWGDLKEDAANLLIV